MGFKEFITGAKNKVAQEEKKILKFLATNKVVIQAVIKYMNMAYDKYDGQAKMAEAVRFLLILCKQNNLADTQSTAIAQAIESGVQSVYDSMKAKGLV